MTVSKYVLDQLAAFGVKRLYGVAGDAQLHLVAETANHEVKFIPVCHENSAGFMAAAEAMLTGGPGVCMATSGPGVANMLNGLGEAYGDKLPVLALTGQVESKKIGTEAKQYVEQQVMLRPLASYSAEVAEANAVGSVLPLALLRSLTRRQLVHLSIPKDLLSQETTSQVFVPPVGIDGQRSPAHIALKEAVAAINQSKRPLILAGLGARDSMDEVERLATAWGAGIITSLGAKGAIRREAEHYLFGLGQGGSEVATRLIQQCDLLLIVGCNWWPQDFIPTVSARVIQIDRSPEAFGCGPAPHTALVGDAHEVLLQLRSELRSSVTPDWTKTIQVSRNDWLKVLEPEKTTPGEGLHPAYVMTLLEHCDLKDHILTVDTGDHTIWFNRHYHGLCKRVLFSGKWRTMGFALPAAIAAGLTSPGQRVVAVTGDGCLNMVLSELATAVREQLPITVLVINNHAYTIEKNRMTNAGLPPIGVDLPEIDYVKVAEACGMEAKRVETPEDLEQALRHALTLNGPYLIDIQSGSPMLPHVKL